MVRHAVLGAIAGGLVLLTPYRALATQQAPLGAPALLSEAPAAAPAAVVRTATGHAPNPVFAVDNPAQPGDAFPNNPYSGGTD
jgi:hypothetical protein